MSQVQRILVPTDFSEISALAIEYAMDMAFRFGASVRFVHVLEDLKYLAGYPDGYIDVPSLRAHLDVEAKEKIAALVKTCEDNRIEAEGVVVTGSAAAIIVDEATAHAIDLIVMGTHGRTGFAHLFVGSVAERVVRMSPCPVLTVRPNARLAASLKEDEAARHQPLPVAAR